MEEEKYINKCQLKNRLAEILRSRQQQTTDTPAVDNKNQNRQNIELGRMSNEDI